MKIKEMDLCIGCMRLLAEDGTCGYCHFPQEDYQPIPRCLKPGTVLSDRYVLGRVLGEGSFGITYIAWDTLLDTAVAIKEYFPSSLASRHVKEGVDHNVYIYEKTEKKYYQDNLKKYLDEAKSLSAFSELDGIVSVRDFFYGNQTAYIVMAYIDGVSLKEYVEKNGRIEGEFFLEMLEPILSSLAKVHETGILHRDISPDNILVTRDHKMVLIDFGAARKENISMTRSMTVVFKQGYSPEEQYRSHGKQGAWSDIYALCATAYYALTGTKPDEAIERVLEDEMQSLEEISDIQLSDQQKRSFMKGIAVHPSERYQTVEELYKDLYHARQDVRKRSVFSRHKTAAIAAVILLSGSFIFLGIWSWQNQNLGKITPIGLLSGVANKGSDGSRQADAAGDLSSSEAPADVSRTSVPLFQIGSYEGLKRPEAERLLADQGDDQLQILWKEGYSDTIGKNVIIKQSIDADTRYHQGDYAELTLTVSRGVRKVTVPSVSGMSRKKAVKRLKKKKLQVVVRQEQSRLVDKGIVIRQSIVEGKKVKEGTQITITVSSGAPVTTATPKPVSTTPPRSDGNKTRDDFAGVIP